MTLSQTGAYVKRGPRRRSPVDAASCFGTLRNGYGILRSTRAAQTAVEWGSLDLDTDHNILLQILDDGRLTTPMVARSTSRTRS